jgi:hypothetical protein
VEELSLLVKSNKSIKERKKELEKAKRNTLNETGKKEEPETVNRKERKSKMQELREEISGVKGKELEGKDIESLIIKEKEPEHLWIKKEKPEEHNTESKKSYFRESHWFKAEKQKKENKVSSLNIKIEEKPLYAEQPDETKKHVLEELKKHASNYKKMNERIKPEKSLMLKEKGLSTKIIKEKGSAGKILKAKKKREPKTEDEILKGFILEKPRKPREPKITEDLLDVKGKFQKIEVPEEKTPKESKQRFVDSFQRMKELESIIPVNPEAKPEKKEEEEENLTVAQQIGNITGFFKRGLLKRMGAKAVDEKIFEGLSKEEIAKAKKLASSLEAAAKKYTKEEIIEALELEGYSKKMIDAIVGQLYS